MSGHPPVARAAPEVAAEHGGEVLRTGEAEVVCDPGDGKLWIGAKPAGGFLDAGPQHVVVRRGSNDAPELIVKATARNPSLCRQICDGRRIVKPLMKPAHGALDPGVCLRRGPAPRSERCRTVENKARDPVADEFGAQRKVWILPCPKDRRNFFRRAGDLLEDRRQGWVCQARKHGSRADRSHAERRAAGQRPGFQDQPGNIAALLRTVTGAVALTGKNPQGLATEDINALALDAVVLVSDKYEYEHQPRRVALLRKPLRGAVVMKTAEREPVAHANRAQVEDAALFGVGGVEPTFGVSATYHIGLPFGSHPRCTLQVPPTRVKVTHLL